MLAGAAVGHAGGERGAAPALVAVGDGPADVATGFATGRGRVVTVAHAVPGRGTVTVRGPDGVARRARVVRRDEALDLAVLAVPGVPATRSARRPRGLPAARSTRAPRGVAVLVRRGATVRALAVREQRRVRASIHHAGDARVVHRPVLALRAAIAPGDSGAPVVAGGRVVGVVFARSHDRAGVAYAVDAAALARLTR